MGSLLVVRPWGDASLVVAYWMGTIKLASMDVGRVDEGRIANLE